MNQYYLKGFLRTLECSFCNNTWENKETHLILPVNSLRGSALELSDQLKLIGEIMDVPRGQWRGG